jgi:hypothetical protein
VRAPVAPRRREAKLLRQRVRRLADGVSGGAFVGAFFDNDRANCFALPRREFLARPFLYASPRSPSK